MRIRARGIKVHVNIQSEMTGFDAEEEISNGVPPLPPELPSRSLESRCLVLVGCALEVWVEVV